MVKTETSNKNPHNSWKKLNVLEDCPSLDLPRGVKKRAWSKYSSVPKPQAVSLTMTSLLHKNKRLINSGHTWCQPNCEWICVRHQVPKGFLGQGPVTQLPPVAALAKFVGGVLGKLVVEEKVLLLHTTCTSIPFFINNRNYSLVCHFGPKYSSLGPSCGQIKRCTKRSQ